MPPALPPQLEVHPLRQPFDRVVRIPGSKSLTHRALMLAALAEGDSTIHHPLDAEDTRLTAEALRALGFELVEQDSSMLIRGRGGIIPSQEASLDLGLAGTAFRLLMGLMSVGRGRYTLDGTARMRERPMGELIAPLRELGATVTCLGEEGYPPLRIDTQGLTGGEVVMRPTLSSQYISALLMAGPLMSRGLTLRFEGPITSRPYVALTLGMMRHFGVAAEVSADWTRIDVKPGRYCAANYTVEPDASSASYFLAAAAIVPGSRVTIEGLGTGSLQGDAAFAEVLAGMWAEVSRDADSVTVRATGKLHGIDIDLNHMPDAAMTPAAIAILADSPTRIRNVGNWRVKETDRMAALREELRRLGAEATVEGDDLLIVPPASGRITPATIKTYDDHRVAMSFALVGLVQPGVTIDDPACVAKSFPTFWQTLNQLAPAGQTVVELPDAVESAG